MNRYVLGSAILGADVTIPKAGLVYDDAATVRVVQQALKARGFDPGKDDGIFGPRTAAAIRAMQAAAGQEQTGVIDYGVLMALRVQAQSGGAAPPVAPASDGFLSRIFSSPAALAPAAAPVSATAGFWRGPAWPGAPFKGWQLVFGAGAGVLAAVGIAGLVRR